MTKLIRTKNHIFAEDLISLLCTKHLMTEYAYAVNTVYSTGSKTKSSRGDNTQEDDNTGSEELGMG